MNAHYFKLCTFASSSIKLSTISKSNFFHVDHDPIAQKSSQDAKRFHGIGVLLFSRRDCND
jgi:hypothetical protein